MASIPCQSAASPDADTPPGTSEYLPALLSRARAAHPDLPLDPIILQSLLICLISQPRSPSGTLMLNDSTGSHVGLHLILRTKEEDVGLVVNLVTLTLQHVLGISTHKSKIVGGASQGANSLIRPKAKGPSTVQHERPDMFLRSLFFRRASHSSFSSHRSNPHFRSSIISDTTPRLGPIPLTGQARNPRNFGHTPQRSASFPAASTDGEEEDRLFDAASLASSRRPLLSGRTPTSTMRSQASRGRPGSHRLRTDPLPLSSLFSPPSTGDIAETEEPIPQYVTSPDSLRAQKSVPFSEQTSDSGGGTASALPKAVVVSGLEHTTPPSQRALMHVLTERRIVFDSHGDEDTDLSGRDLEVEDGSWNLPDGFLMVYVCKLDPHERPAISRGLIDKFSMSADISLPPSLRQSYFTYRAAHSPTPRGTPIPSPLALPHHPFFTTQAPVRLSPARRSVPLPVLPPQAPPVLPASELAHLRMLARPFPAAAPIFYPSVYATVHTQMVCPLPAPSAPYAALHPSLDAYLLDLFAATRHHPALDGTLLTMRAHADAEALARAFRVLNGDTVGTVLIEREAKLGARELDRETAAALESLDGRGWMDGRSASPSVAWMSTESVVANGNGYGHGNSNGLGKGKVLEEFGLGSEKGVRLQVDDVDGGSQRFTPDVYDALLAAAGTMTPELSPAEVLDTAMKRAWPEVWDVSEEDVARIFPRVVSHRLRVRDGPDDELLSSVMWPAVPVDNSAASFTAGGHVRMDAEKGRVRLGWERKSVKEILVRILADV